MAVDKYNLKIVIDNIDKTLDEGIEIVKRLIEALKEVYKYYFYTTVAMYVFALFFIMIFVVGFHL